jgi:hypothetical protein
LLALLKHNEQSRPCFHCAGLQICDCISCNKGLSLERGNLKVRPGACIACRGKAGQ